MIRRREVAQDQWNQSGHPEPERQRSHRPGRKTRGSVGTSEKIGNGSRGSVGTRVTVGLSNSGHTASEKQQVFRTIGLCAQWTKGPLGTHTRRNSGHRSWGTLHTQEQLAFRKKGTVGTQDQRNKWFAALENPWGHKTRRTMDTQKQRTEDTQDQRKDRFIGPGDVCTH